MCMGTRGSLGRKDGKLSLQLSMVTECGSVHTKGVKFGTLVALWNAVCTACLTHPRQPT